MRFQELDNDQRREAVNTGQRYAVWREAKARAAGYRGSLIWQEAKGEEYLVRAYYDASGKRRQTSLGRRSSETEGVKAEWERGRAKASERLRNLRDALGRQAGVNRALGLGRMPLTGARVVRAIDEAGLFGAGIRIVGTNAIYAYEAAAGVWVDSSVTTTLDIDLLLDSRRSLRIASGDEVDDRTLMDLLRKADRTFERTGQSFRAVNRDGYLVDLIKPLRDPPWAADQESMGEEADDLVAASVDGLAWLESAPSFEATVIDERGGPLRMVAVDPRAFAAYKLWMSRLDSRDPLKRRRDAAQAEAVAAIVARHLTHLPFEAAALRMRPRAVAEAARPLFAPGVVPDDLSF